MITRVNNQLILVGVLAAVLAAVLFVTFIRDASPSESGLDSPTNLGLVESELVPEPGEGWQAPEIQRNPFVGPFSSQSVSPESELEVPVSESVPDADSE